MDAASTYPENLEERIVFWSIVWTWGFYLLGALYLLGPVIGWVLAVLAVKRWYSRTNTQLLDQLPAATLIWCIGMVAMLIVLVIGHLNWNLGIPQLIKSSIGWAKGWALLALFIFAGSSLHIRPKILARALNLLALQTLILLPLFIASAYLHLPSRLYVSPLLMLGGPGPEYFEVQLYGVNAGGGGYRWRFFSPWAPAAGMVANVSLVVAMLDTSWKWKAIGLVSAIAICLLSQSRLALIVILAVPAIVAVLSRLLHPITILLGGIASALGGVFAGTILAFIQQALDRFTAARADSSRVRAALGRIALDRWANEAPWFGHGIVERGPHLVEYMPIGSHHTWLGLLYVKGILGLLALAIPMLVSFFEALGKAQNHAISRAALSMLMILAFYTFGENLEVLAYLFWPGLLVIGMSSRQAVLPLFPAVQSR